MLNKEPQIEKYFKIQDNTVNKMFQTNLDVSKNTLLGCETNAWFFNFVVRALYTHFGVFFILGTTGGGKNRQNTRTYMRLRNSFEFIL